MRRNQSGFTLVEMLVSIVVGSLVTLAATTVLLLGLRINNQSTRTVIRQNTARVVITMLENLAAEGEINSIETQKTVNEITQWCILNADSGVLAQFSKEDGAIYVGNSAEPMLDGIKESHISLDGKVLTIYVETDEGGYKSSIYCRTMRIPEEVTGKEEEAVGKVDTPDVDFKERDDADARLAFLKVLASQHRLAGGSANPGLILDGSGRSTGKYYSEWYVRGYDDVNKPGWGPETPWCACFISWGLNEVKARIQENQIPQDRVQEDGDCIWYASVDQFAAYFQNSENEHRFEPAKTGETYFEPVPGDIIFIDWDGADDEGNFDPAHVGAVLWVDEDNRLVYTIEGNSTGEIVAVKSYPIDSEIIMGYGVLKWTET